MTLEVQCLDQIYMAIKWRQLVSDCQLQHSLFAHPNSCLKACLHHSPWNLSAQEQFRFIYLWSRERARGVVGEGRMPVGLGAS